MTTKLLIVAATLAFALQPLLAQNTKVYRCENAAGRVTYADEACQGGAELKNADARSDEQRKAAADVARREEKLADRMTKERRIAEKAKAPAAAGLIRHFAADDAAKTPTKPTDKNGAKKKKKASEKKGLSPDRTP